MSYSVTIKHEADKKVHVAIKDLRMKPQSQIPNDTIIKKRIKKEDCFVLYTIVSKFYRGHRFVIALPNPFKPH